MILGKYQTQRNRIKKRGYSLTAEVFNEQGEVLFAKWITGIRRNSQPSKILFDKLRHLKKATHPALPAIVEYDWDDTEQAYCIISENKNALTLEETVREFSPTSFLKGMEQIVSCLQHLQQSHRLSHGDITPANILVDNDFNFYLIDFGLTDISTTLSQEQSLEVFAKEFAAPEKWNRKVPKGFPYQSDIFSIGKVIEWFFNHNDLVEFEEVTALINDSCAAEPVNRINYNSLLEGLQRISSTIVFDRENIVLIENVTLELLEELNDEEFRPKFDVNPKSRDVILVDFTTKNLCVHCLWLAGDQKLLVRNIERKEQNERKYTAIDKYGVKIGMPVRFAEGLYYGQSCFNLSPFFKSLQQAKQHEGEYRKGKIEVNKTLSFFKKLLEKELQVLEEDSLRLRYESYEKKGQFEVWFKVLENEKYSNNGHVFSHIDKSTPPNPEEFEYILSQTTDKRQMKDPLKFSGVCYDFNDKTRVIKFKDCERVDFNKIPQRGYLFENISKKEEEKKRQKEAIRKVEFNEVQNRELIHYLFNPNSLSGSYLGDIELAEVFQKDNDGRCFQYSPNQNRAILNALHRKPLTVIQGPPGTGKTTVITEIVFQILNKNPDAKILITSQTNDAVDNVLDNLLEKDIPIVRLSGVRKPKDSLRKHTLERKIEGWKQEVKTKAQNEWKSLHHDFLLKVEKESVFIKSIIDILLQKKDWKIRKGQVEKLINQFNGLEHLVGSFEDEESLVKSLDSQSKCGIAMFFEKHQIHEDWIAAVSSLDEKSNVNQKLIDSIRVIGATTNHIASKKYSKYNFEFDYVIMDESGKATTAEALIPIVLAQRLVLVGDHRQLRPMLTANRKVEKWLREEYKSDSDEFDSWDDYFNRPSLFEDIITTIDDDFKSQLEECRRMPEDAVRLTSKCFYEPFGDEPIVPILRSSDKEHNLDLKVNSSIVFLDIGNSYKSEIDQSGSSKNKESAAIIPKVLVELDKFELVKGYSIGIITGYSAQMKEIRRVVRNELQRQNKRLSRINIQDTAISVVDKFQGLEKDIIIFDLARSRQNTLGFLANANRINVALSRHKRLLIIIGNYDWLVSVKSKAQNGNTLSEVPLQKYLKEINPNWLVKDVKQLF